MERKPLHTQQSSVCEGKRQPVRQPPASGVSRVNVAAVSLPGREGFVPVSLSRIPPPQSPRRGEMGVWAEEDLSRAAASHGQVLGPQTFSLRTLPGLFPHGCIRRTHSALRWGHGDVKSEKPSGGGLSALVGSLSPGSQISLLR